MRNRLLVVASAGLSLSLTPALSAEETKPAAPPEPHGITCAFVPNVRGFISIDESHIVLEGIGSTKYLITFVSRCHALNYAIDISLDRHGSDLCSGDAIIARNDRCMIRYVEKVRNTQEGRDIVAARLAAEEAKSKEKSGQH